MRPWWFGLVLLAGCDLVYGLEGREPDGGEDTEPCLIGTPFRAGTPVQIGDLGYSVEGARFSSDQQTAYLSLCALGQSKSTCELFSARYYPAEKRFAQLFQLDTLDQPGAYDAYPTITADGRFFLWGSDRNSHLDVYVAEEENGQFPASKIAKLTAASGLNSNEPYVLSDSETVYFGGESGTGRGWELYRSHGPGPGFGTREVLAQVSSDFDDAAPVVSDDELEIFFASERDGTHEGHDIYTGFRTNKNDPFAIRKLDALSTPSPGIDWPLWLSPDLCTLYYINKDSNEPTATARLYVTSRR